MGKQGPCCHCGVTNTPLWRNGPPEKPVLCNACGSRWRTKGSLTNYTPLHARGEPVEMVFSKVPKIKIIHDNNKEQKMLKRKLKDNKLGWEDTAADCSLKNQKGLDEDMSNRSSTGSGISYSESCAYFPNIDSIEFSGSSQTAVWDSLVPSRKRTCFSRPKQSSVEKLRKDLCFILHEQESSYISESSEDNLLFESETPIGSVEIGNGSVLLKYRNVAVQEEESEASSLLLDSRVHSIGEAYSTSSSKPVYNQSKESRSWEANKEKPKQVVVNGLDDNVNREKVPYDGFHCLQSGSSPLKFVKLKDVLNFEEFSKHLTRDEQNQLMCYLSSVDASKYPTSVKNLFENPEFEEALVAFQKLLSDGIFDLSFLGGNIEECKSLRKLVLTDMTKSRWVEMYTRLIDSKSKKALGKEPQKATCFLKSSKSSVGKRSCDGQSWQDFAEPKAIKHELLNSPLRTSPLSSFSKNGKDVCGSNEAFEWEASYSSPTSLFGSSSERNSGTFDSPALALTDDFADQDLLLDVPSNVLLQQAELLHYPWNQRLPRVSSSIKVDIKHEAFATQQSSNM